MPPSNRAVLGAAVTRTLLILLACSGSARSTAELYHWCAMVFGAHWRQRIGVALARE
jgi:hypothetical protein